MDLRTKDYWSFADLRKDGLVPYSLAPVYAYSGVTEDIPLKFMEESIPKRPKEVRIGRILCASPLVTHCQELGCYLEVMDKEGYLFFKQWMLSQQFVNWEKKAYFEVRHWMARLYDPVAITANQVQTPETLELFTLSGFKGMMRPYCPVAKAGREKVSQGFVLLEVVPPDENVVTRGRAALAIVKEGL